MALKITFYVKELAGRTTVIRDFDMAANTVADFRARIPVNWRYTLSVHPQAVRVLYPDDDDDCTLLAHFTNYMPSILHETEVTLLLVCNLGPGGSRRGIQHVPVAKRGDVVDVCPISLEPPACTIKLCGQFYDVDAIARYIVDQYRRDHTFANLIYPLRQQMPEELKSHLLAYHMSYYETQGVSEKSVVDAIQSSNVYRHAQAEYDTKMKAL